MSNAPLTLSDDEHAALDAAVRELGAMEVGRRLGIGREPVTRLLARLRVQRGTFTLATQNLAALRAA